MQCGESYFISSTDVELKTKQKDTKVKSNKTIDSSVWKTHPFIYSPIQQILLYVKQCTRLIRYQWWAKQIWFLPLWTDMIPSLMELPGSVYVLRVGSGVSDRGSIMCKNLKLRVWMTCWGNWKQLSWLEQRMRQKWVMSPKMYIEADCEGLY